MGEAKRRRDRAATLPKVALGYVHSDTLAACFIDSRDALIAYDQMHDGLLAHAAGKMAVRGGTDGLVAARNTVAAQVVASDVDWLLWIDSDMGFAPDALYQLLAVAHPTDRPIVGGLCFTSRQYAHDGTNGYRTRPQPTVYDWRQADDGQPRFLSMPMYPVDHVIQVAGTGSAFILIHRSVFEYIADKMGPAWYDRTPGTDGKLLGEDISFCVRAASLGIPIHVHTGVRTTHFKQQWMGETDHWRAYVPPQATEEVAVVVTDPGPAFVASLRASTGLARIHGSPWESGADVTEPWLFVTSPAVRFHAGWLDHALHVADSFDAKVIGTNSLDGEPAGLLINRRYLVDECGGVLSTLGPMEEIARNRGVYQLALGAVVERLPEPAEPAGPTERTWTVPRYAIIPTHNRHEKLTALVASLGTQCDHIVVLDNASDPPLGPREAQQLQKLVPDGCLTYFMHDDEQPPHLSRFWNAMLDTCAELAKELGHDVYDIAILNDDAVIPAGWYDACARGLREGDAQVAHTDPTSPRLLRRVHNNPANRMCPHAIVVRGEVGQRADEAMRWWYFDSDWDQTARLAGGVLSVPGPRVVNSLANTTTVGPLFEQAQKDRAAFEAKWSR